MEISLHDLPEEKVGEKIINLDKQRSLANIDSPPQICDFRHQIEEIRRLCLEYTDEIDLLNGNNFIFLYCFHRVLFALFSGYPFHTTTLNQNMANLAMAPIHYCKPLKIGKKDMHGKKVAEINNRKTKSHEIVKMRSEPLNVCSDSDHFMKSAIKMRIIPGQTGIYH
jgi:hypothetical protein